MSFALGTLGTLLSPELSADVVGIPFWKKLFTLGKVAAFEVAVVIAGMLNPASSDPPEGIVVALEPKKNLPESAPVPSAGRLVKFPEIFVAA
jgi:hypothetical protein